MCNGEIKGLLPTPSVFKISPCTAPLYLWCRKRTRGILQCKWEKKRKENYGFITSSASQWKSHFFRYFTFFSRALSLAGHFLKFYFNIFCYLLHKILIFEPKAARKMKKVNEVVGKEGKTAKGIKFSTMKILSTFFFVYLKVLFTHKTHSNPFCEAPLAAIGT